MVKLCFICGCTRFRHRTHDYLCCESCGHEVFNGETRQAFIVNDPLDAIAVKRTDNLDRFKNALMNRWVARGERSCLLDVGSSSGKFLDQQRVRFQRVIGVEVTPEVRRFSVDVLGLDVRGDIRSINEPISVATFWHSLEHIPEEELNVILEFLERMMLRGGKLIASVPNNASFQYQWLGRSYAFFDVPSHLHQFSPQSLRELLRRHGFVEVDRAVSWPYNIFGYVQGLLNVATHSHNYFYYRLKRRSAPQSWRLDVLNIVILPIAGIMGGMLAILDMVFPSKQGVLTVCFRKT